MTSNCRAEEIAPVRLAVVGCGQITEESHLPAILKSNLARVSALIDADPGRPARLLQKYGCKARTGRDVREVLTGVDGVVIATPNGTHAAVARAALEAGIPVLVEKPLATSYADAETLCRLAERRGTFISVGYVTRHYPAVRLVKRLLSEGFFGRVRGLHCEYGTAGGWAPVSGYNLDRRQAGGGVLVVSGSHWLDRLLYWFGEPVSWEYADDSCGGVEANCKIRLEFDSPSGPFPATMFFSKTTQLKNKAVIETDLYVVEDQNRMEEVVLFPRSAPGTRMLMGAWGEGAPPAAVDVFQEQIDEFARAIRGAGAPTVDGRFAALSVKYFERFYECRRQLEEPWRPGWSAEDAAHA